MDEAILRAVNAWALNEDVARIATFLSAPMMAIFVCTPLALYLMYKRRFVALASVALAMGVGDVVTARILKPTFDRERPCRAVDGLVEVARCGVGRSYPSGHATVSFAFYVAAAGVTPYGWILLLPPALGISGSRVVLGVHYPSDVAGGAVVGSLIGALAICVRRRALKSPTRDRPSHH